MKIAVDIRSFLSRETGVGIYLKNLLFSLAEIDKKNRYLLFSSSFKERLKRDKLPHFNDIKIKDLKIPVKILNFLWFNLSFPSLGLFFKEKPDLVHSPNPLIIPGGRKTIITVHDLAFIDNPSLTTREAQLYFSKGIRRSLQKSDGIISVSQFTKERILKHFGSEIGNKIKVIYHGSDLKSVNSIKPKFVIPEKFLLFTGTLEPRKNISTLIKAFSLLRNKIKDLKLILAGALNSSSSHLLRLISVLKLENSIIITGYLKREELKYLYENCFAFIFPSLYEGFGIPVLEAAECQKPSITSDIPVFHELYSDYPLYFSKESPEELCEAILKLDSNSSLYKKKCQMGVKLSKKFSWEKCARETLSFYGEIAG